jgi:hypothetical protein
MTLLKLGEVGGRDATGVVIGSAGEDVGSDEELELNRCTT